MAFAFCRVFYLFIQGWFFSLFHFAVFIKFCVVRNMHIETFFSIFAQCLICIQFLRLLVWICENIRLLKVLCQKSSNVFLCSYCSLAHDLLRWKIWLCVHMFCIVLWLHQWDVQWYSGVKWADNCCSTTDSGAICRPGNMSEFSMIVIWY